MSVGLAKRGAIQIVLSNTVLCHSDDSWNGRMTKTCSFEESVTKANLRRSLCEYLGFIAR